MQYKHVKERLELALFNGLLKTIQPTLEAVLQVMEKSSQDRLPFHRKRPQPFFNGWLRMKTSC